MLTELVVDNQCHACGEYLEVISGSRYCEQCLDRRNSIPKLKNLKKRIKDYIPIIAYDASAL